MCHGEAEQARGVCRRGVSDLLFTEAEARAAPDGWRCASFWGIGGVRGVASFADTPVWDNRLNTVDSADHHSRLQSLEAQMHSMRALLQDVVSAVCPEIRGSRE